MSAYYSSVRITGIDSIEGQKYGRSFGPSTLDVKTETQDWQGAYREVTTITLVGAWKVRPSTPKKKRWWQR